MQIIASNLAGGVMQCRHVEVVCRRVDKRKEIFISGVLQTSKCIWRTRFTYQLKYKEPARTLRALRIPNNNIPATSMSLRQNFHHVKSALISSQRKTYKRVTNFNDMSDTSREICLLYAFEVSLEGAKPRREINATQRVCLMDRRVAFSPPQ